MTSYAVHKEASAFLQTTKYERDEHVLLILKLKRSVTATSGASNIHFKVDLID